jgi:hypothetical protein
MTVASGRRRTAPLAQRLRQIEPQVQLLVTAAQQLELDRDDLHQLIDRNWERQHGK